MFEIINGNETFGIRNIETHVYVIPWGLQTMAEAEEALAEIEAEAEEGNEQNAQAHV